MSMFCCFQANYSQGHLFGNCSTWPETWRNVFNGPQKLAIWGFHMYALAWKSWYINTHFYIYIYQYVHTYAYTLTLILYIYAYKIHLYITARRYVRSWGFAYHYRAIHSKGQLFGIHGRVVTRESNKAPSFENVSEAWGNHWNSFRNKSKGTDNCAKLDIWIHFCARRVSSKSDLLSTRVVLLN